MALFIKENGSLVQVSVGHEISKPEQQKSVSLDLASGDQIVTPDNGQVLTQVLIKKPETLLASNIKKDVNIAGVVGSLENVDTLAKRINSDGNLYDYVNEISTYIRSYAFYADKNIQHIEFKQPTITISNSAFNGCTNMVSFKANEVINFQNTSSAFGACSNFETFDATAIGTSVPSNCFQDTKLSVFDFSHIGNSNGSSIGSSAFKNTLLKNVNITAFNQNGRLYSSCFYGCSLLETVYINDCQVIENLVFSNCTSLTDITIGRSSSICTLNNVNAFSGVTPPVTIHVPSDLISSYQSATNWSTLYNDGKVTFVAIQ